MKAMLLAAGLGKRMRPLTDRLPKPLLPIGGTTLIEHHLVRLGAAGFTEVVINLHYLGSQIREQVGDGSRYGVSVQYSEESTLLETGGGIRRALPLLGPSPFLVVSADIYIDLDFSVLAVPLLAGTLGRLVMVPNPPHHPGGDFSIDPQGYLRIVESGQQNPGHPPEEGMTWSSVGVIHPELLGSESDEHFPLRRVFDRAIADSSLTGDIHQGYWCDVGTPARYQQLLSDLRTADLGG